MQQPSFWYRQPGLAAAALSPLSLIWSMATRTRLARPAGSPVGVPVICVGNINVGGSGKTPAVIALATRIQGWGVEVHIVTRGYRGVLSGPLEVDVGQHDSSTVGDEALLLAGFTRTWKSEDRLAGARSAAAAGAEVIILDDGHQNPRPSRDISLVVVDAGRGFGNGRIIPAGPLRESVIDGLSRADMLLVVGQKPARDRFLDRWQDRINVPVLEACLEVLPTGVEWQGMKVFGFAGIGHPDKFRATLESTGAKVVGFRALADHQALDDMLMKRIESEALGLDAQLVTTEKDAARLVSAWKRRVVTLPVRMHLEDWLPIDRQLASLGIKSID